MDEIGLEENANQGRGDCCDGAVQCPQENDQTCEEENESQLQDDRDDDHDGADTPSDDTVETILPASGTLARIPRNADGQLVQPLLDHKRDGGRCKATYKTGEPERVDPDGGGGSTEMRRQNFHRLGLLGGIHEGAANGEAVQLRRYSLQQGNGRVGRRGLQQLV